MKPGTRNITVASVLLVALIAAVAWTVWDERVPSDRLLVAGNVRSELYAVTAPSVTYPTPDYAVGISSDSATMSSSGSSGGAANAKAAAAKQQASRSMQPVVSGRLTSVTVRQGDSVKRGAVIATLDPTLLELGVRQARTAAARARSDVSLMSSNLDTVASNQSKLATARSKIKKGTAQLSDAKANLVAARKKLVATRAKARAGKKTLEAQIAALEQQIANGGSRPTSPTPGPTPQQILAQMKAKLAELEAGIKQMDAGIAKMDAGLTKLAAAEAKIASAKSKLATGASALADAKQQLTNAKDVLGKVADARSIGVKAAEAQLAVATITAPVDGVVTFARPSGVVTMVGAPIVRIMPAREQLVDTYLTSEQLARVRVGAKAEVSSDSFPGQTLAGRVVTIGSASVFPPTNFPTDIVHMTRAVKVTVAIDSATQLPPGTPVDLAIFTTSDR